MAGSSSPAPGERRPGAPLPHTRGAGRGLALLPVLLWGCATAPPALPPPTGIPLRVSEFSVFQGDSLVAIEYVAHYGDRIEGAVDVTGRARVNYVARMAGPHVIDRIEARMRPWQGTSAATEVSVDFGEDSIRVRRSLSRRARAEPHEGGGAMPYLHPSPALLEQIVLQALQAGGGDVEIPVWLVSANAATVARISFASSRIADVEIARGRIRVWFDDFGLLLAEMPSVGWLIQRRGG